MADDSQTPPNINLYNVASDDALWVLETDHVHLLPVLANPAGWVHDNVKVNGEPAILWEPFVVVFHEVPATEGSGTPTIHVQGIHETAVLTVRYSRSAGPVSPPARILPEGEILAILQVGNVVHTHLQFTGFSKMDIASSLFATVTTPEAYVAAMNALPQTLNGVATATDKKLVFKLNPTSAPHVVYQGWTPKPATSMAETSVPKQEETPDCIMSNGDANSQGQVIVNGIIVKTYTLP